MEAQKIHGQTYLYQSWDRMGRVCFSLAKQILDAGSPCDRLVALAKGGWTWARTMVDYLGMNKVASVQYEFYTNVEKTKDEPTLKQSLPVSVENERLLIFDDVVDSGETLSAARSYLKKCGATSISTASLFFKPHSKFKPDFFAEKTNAWVIFPHEIREAVNQLTKRWKGHDEEQIEDNFLKLGLPKEEVKHFMHKNS